MMNANDWPESSLEQVLPSAVLPHNVSWHFLDLWLSRKALKAGIHSVTIRWRFPLTASWQTSLRCALSFLSEFVAHP
jgi:hypothetical protein